MSGIYQVVTSILGIALIAGAGRFGGDANEKKAAEPIQTISVQEKSSQQVMPAEQTAQVSEKPEVDQQPIVKEKTEGTPAIQTAEPAEKKSTLSGKIICIDAGHQQKGNSSKEPVAPGSKKTKAKVSSGTRGVSTGKYEYALNLEVALQLETALKAKGATVYMVRKTNQVDISNAERAQLANKVQADLSLRLHADGSGNSSVQGFSILVPGGAYVSKDTCAKSKQAATCLEAALSKGIDNPSRGIVTRKDLTGFNWCKVPAVLIEMGFMTNPKEDQRMSTPAFQKDFVEAVTQGLEAYFQQADKQ